MTVITALLVLLLSNGCSGCGEGCSICEIRSQICLGCKDGYWLHHDKCMSCLDNCEQCTDNTHCSKCKTNFWGTGTCDKQCPDSCDESGCEYKSGQCYKCQPGFYGTRCLQNCSLCKDELCDSNDGQCINGCIDGYYWDSANVVKTCQKCFYNCQLCQNQAICLGCDNGFYILSYETSTNNPVTLCYPCPATCEECNTDSACTVCKSGTYGPLCQYNCSDSHCHRCNKVDNVETCTECVSGYDLKANSCVPETICSQNCANACYQNALCVGGCKDGWSGQTCTVQCARKCQTCAQNNNTVCKRCKGDYFMSSCDSPCNDKCSRHTLQETCRLQGGFCLIGCKDGYWGDTCNNSCNTGCKTRCSQTEGSCLTCHRKYYGQACEYPCSENCVDDGSILQICRKSDGKCQLGCNNDYSGERCDETSSQGITTFPTSVTQETGSQYSKQDTNGNETTFYLLGFVTGVVFSLLVAAGIGLFLYLRRRQRFTAESINTLENHEQREYENTSVGMRVMPSNEVNYPNNNREYDQASAEVSLNVYERLQNDKRDDKQQYSELRRPKE